MCSRVLRTVQFKPPVRSLTSESWSGWERYFSNSRENFLIVFLSSTSADIYWISSTRCLYLTDIEWIMASYFRFSLAVLALLSLAMLIRKLSWHIWVYGPRGILGFYLVPSFWPYCLVTLSSVVCDTPGFMFVSLCCLTFEMNIFTSGRYFLDYPSDAICASFSTWDPINVDFNDAVPPKSFPLKFRPVVFFCLFNSKFGWNCS